MRQIKYGLISLAVIVLLVLVAGCSSQGSDLNKQTKKNKDATQPVSQTDRESKESPEQTSKSQTSLDVSKKQYAVIETNKGRIVFQLFSHKAPNTVKNFIKLANSGFFNGIKWHRYEPGFVIQGGDPNSRDNDPSNDGFGGPGYTIKAEINDAPHLRGTVAMAHNAKSIDSAGSQFYICLSDQPRLDGQYTVFGQVTEGMDVVDQIRVGDIMNKVYIEEK